MKNTPKLKYIAIVIFCSVLDFILHGITSSISPMDTDKKFSILAKTIGVMPTATLWIFIAFSCLAYVFYRYEDKLPGIKGGKGLRYGSAIGLLWFWGMIESVSLQGTTIIYEGVMGLCDATPVVVMGLLLGKFIAERSPIKENNKSFNKITCFLSLFIFSIVFLIGRYLLYVTKIIHSGYEIRPYITLIWTILMGTCTGVAYILLGRATKSSSTLLSAIKFGAILFGINWSVFLVFIPMVFQGCIVDVIIRSILDISLVTLSYYLSESLGQSICYKKEQK